MNKIYYSKGLCELDNEDIKALQINFNGKIKIKDETPSDYTLLARNNIILIFFHDVLFIF